MAGDPCGWGTGAWDQEIYCDILTTLWPYVPTDSQWLKWRSGWEYSHEDLEATYSLLAS